MIPGLIFLVRRDIVGYCFLNLENEAIFQLLDAAEEAVCWTPKAARRSDRPLAQ